MSDVLRPADHRCAVLYRSAYGQHGTIIGCPECGTAWRAVEPGNPAYAGWVRVGRLELRIRMWFAERNTRRHS
jgi:hypothetical protein